MRRVRGEGAGVRNRLRIDHRDASQPDHLPLSHPFAPHISICPFSARRISADDKEKENIDPGSPQSVIAAIVTPKKRKANVCGRPYKRFGGDYLFCTYDQCHMGPCEGDRTLKRSKRSVPLVWY